MSLQPLLKKIIAHTLVISVITATASSHAEVKQPELDNTAFVLMDYNTGEILAQKNANTPLPPASLTKMMTSYIIEDKLTDGSLKEDEPVLMSENAWCRGSSRQSCMYVPVNKTASMIDMLRGIIIQSGNDASVAVAEHIAGSEQAFSMMMNEEAKKLGMTNTNFLNATGMPAEGHQASAIDLAVLAKAIIGHGTEYYGIYAEKEFTYNNITQGNRNTLLRTDPTIDGLKTGHTNAAGYCLVASGKKNDMRLVSVILGAKSMQARADQSRELLNWGYGHFQTVTQAQKGQFVSKIPVWFGEKDEVELATADSLQVLTMKVNQGVIETVMNINENVEAPIKRGDKLGELVSVINGKSVASVDIIATHDVEESGFVSRMFQHVVRWVKNIF